MSSSRHPRRLRTAFAALRHGSSRCRGAGTSGSDSAPVKRTVRDSISPLRVGFVGSFIPTKAPHLLIEAARMLPAGSVTVDLAGEIASYHGDDWYRTRLEPLLSDPVVSRHGSVPHDRMPEHLSRSGRSRPAVGLAGELAARHQGSIRRRAARRRLETLEECEKRCAARWTAFCSSPGTLRALAAQLRRLQSEPGLFERLRSGIAAPAAIEQDAAALRSLYSRLISSPKKRGVTVAAPSLHASRVDARTVTAVVLNYRTPDQTWLAVRSLQTSLPPPGSILVVDNGSSDGSADGLRRAFSGPCGSVERYSDRAFREPWVSRRMQRRNRVCIEGWRGVGLPGQ